MKPFLISIALVLLLPAAHASARSWSDTYGTTIQGNFVRIHNGDVIIEKVNKSVAKVPYWNLSETDRDYVKEQLEAKGQTNLIPPEPSKVSASGPGAGNPDAGLPGSGFPGAGGPGAPLPGGPGSGAPGFTPPPFNPPGVGPEFTPPMPSGSGYPTSTGPGSAPGYPPPSTNPGSLPTPGFGRIPGYPPGMSPPGSNPPGSGYPGSTPSFTPPSYTPPTMPEIPSLKFRLSCRKCGHSWTSDTPDTFAPCPSCNNNGLSSGNSPTGSGGYTSPAPFSNPNPPPFSTSSANNPNTLAARQAGVMVGLLLMVGCPLVIGLVVVVAIIAIIFFVIKAVSSPAPAPIRRNY